VTRGNPMSDSGSRIPYRACPLCDSAEIAEYKSASCAHHPLYRPTLAPTMRWMRCVHCGHVFTHGYWSPAALGDIFSVANPHQMPGNNPHGSRAMAARMVEKVMRHSKVAGGRWLDVGFGNGALLGAAEEYGFSVVGLDLRSQAVDLMRADGIEAYVMELGAYHPESPPDVISMADVLEHIPYPVPALRGVHTLLAPEGLLFVSMPNSDCYTWRMLDRLGTNPYWGELEHYHNFGRQRLHSLLRQHGFEPIEYGIGERYYMCMEVIARKVACAAVGEPQLQ
jgi:SAM-dependent methyltransferase